MKSNEKNTQTAATDLEKAESTKYHPKKRSILDGTDGLRSFTDKRRPSFFQ
jgi:hypothetical protein